MPLMLAPGQPVSEFLPPILMTVGVVILGWLLIATIRGKISRRNADQPTSRERIDRIKSSAHLDPSEEHMADLLTLAQRLSTQLDAKAARLDQLIDLADERITLLTAELDETSAFEQFASAPPAHAAPVHSSSAPAARPADSRPAAAGNGTAERLAQSVYALADGGRSPVEIAQQLDEHTGKIELILAMRR